MSIQSARDFLTRMTKDEKFRKAFGDCKTGIEQQQYARASGFDFTVDEIKEVRNELQDADLDAVSGGCCGCEGGDCGSSEMPH